MPHGPVDAHATAQLDGEQRARGRRGGRRGTAGHDRQRHPRSRRGSEADDDADGSWTRDAPGADRFRAATVPIGARHLSSAHARPAQPARPQVGETRANHDAMAALVADLRARQATVAGRGAGGDERSIARHRERGKLPVRERIERLLDPGSAFLELSPLAATGLYDDDAPARRHRHRHRPDRGHDLRRRRQRRHRQGRHLLPDDGQEAPAGPGDRPREPAAVRLPRRFGRRVPAAPGGGLPGSRPLRPDLLQPGPDVRGRHPAGRARDGLVDGRRRLRPGDERRDGHRPRHRDDLPRRAAAGEGRDRART